MCYRFSTGAYQIQLHTCDTNQHCELNQMDSSYDYDLLSTGLYCRGSSYLDEKKFPGEECQVKQECRSGVCGQNICQGKPVGSMCADYGDCESGLACINSQCEFQRTVGSECTLHSECTNDLLCHSNLCTAYFSLKSGESGIEHPYLCESGYAESGVCQLAPANVKSPDSTCSSDSDCDLTNGQPGSCECGLTEEGLAFCRAEPGDDEFQNYQNLLRQVLPTSVSCHYNISLSSRCRLQANNPVFSSYLNAFYIYRYRAQIISIPSCIVSAMPFSEDYPYSNASIGSSGGSNTTVIIAVCVCVFVGLVVVGVLICLCARRLAKREARESRVQNAISSGDYESIGVLEGAVLVKAPGELWTSKFEPANIVIALKEIVYLQYGIPVCRAVHPESHTPIDGLEAALPLASPKNSSSDTLAETATETKRSTALFVKRSA